MNNPMQFEFNCCVVENDEICEHFIATMEDIANMVLAKYNQYSEDCLEIVLCGPVTVLSKIKNEIMEKAIDNYSIAPTITII